MPDRRLRRWGRLLLLLLSVPLGVLGAVVGFFGMAFVTSSVPILALTGVLALLLLTGWLSGLACRGMFGRRRKLRRWLPVSVTGAALFVAGLTAGVLVFQPMDVSYVPKEPTDRTRYWDLPTGSRLAYALTPAEGAPKPTPVVMLHGGPGAPGSFEPRREDRVLSEAGFDVYRYDQVGAGLSERLEEVDGYTVGRHVEDLEAIRKEIGADRLILIGGSWGGTLAAHYMASHPDKVEKAVVSSPGAIWAPAFADEGVSHGPEGEIISDAATLRFVAVLVLQQINPEAAQNLAPDREMSAFFQRLIGRIIASDTAGCGARGEAIEPPSEPRIPRGFSYYANALTVASINRVEDPRPALEDVETPVLVLRGECDRLRGAVTREYRDVFPNATLLVIEGASHSIGDSRPVLYADLVHSFLTE
ncbi:MAG: alpha/beta hydrolase [Rubrobacteraceae bacterium]